MRCEPRRNISWKTTPTLLVVETQTWILSSQAKHRTASWPQSQKRPQKVRIKPHCKWIWRSTRKKNTHPRDGCKMSELRSARGDSEIYTVQVLDEGRKKERKSFQLHRCGRFPPGLNLQIMALSISDLANLIASSHIITVTPTGWQYDWPATATEHSNSMYGRLQNVALSCTHMPVGCCSQQSIGMAIDYIATLRTGMSVISFFSNHMEPCDL